jgi:two-component system, cell cycle sensor histidine kinase and response regulator CckA
VLVVEDEPAVRATVSLALKRFGYTVLAAKDGVEAVEVFRQRLGEIRCVLCDLTMPRMNGWETLAALRKLSPGIPVILSSGYSEAQVMEGHHPDLPQAFLNKPYQFAALAAAITRVLANKTAPENVG